MGLHDETPNAPVSLRFEIRGTVQGVGFRPWALRQARSLGLRGRVCNVGDGVCVDAFGPPEALAAFRERLAAA